MHRYSTRSNNKEHKEVRMVTISSKRESRGPLSRNAFVVVAVGALTITIVLLSGSLLTSTTDTQTDHRKDPGCPYLSLSDLTPEERFPSKGSRHMIDPPADSAVSLVCCQTTQGPWNFVIHHDWAPIGAERILDMVQTGYFNSRVPLMRCVRGFLCQFGLAGAASKAYGMQLQDDPNWLPEGPTHRENEDGVKRFAVGYMAYAGGGENSRTQQLIVALADNGPLAGGSPWEVPWGEMVGKHSFETLSKVYTGYGEKGPSQGLLHREGCYETVEKDFPDLDWIESCSVVDQDGVA